MTTAESMRIIGQERTIQLGSLTIDVRVLDIKNSYGRTRYLVQPLSGCGKQWVESIGANRCQVSANVSDIPYAQLGV